MIAKINQKNEFKVVNVDDHIGGSSLKDDLYFLNESKDIQNSLVEKIKSEQKVILQGYPYDLNSAYNLQKKGIIPTKIFVIRSDQESIERNINNYLKKHSDQVVTGGVQTADQMKDQITIDASLEKEKKIMERYIKSKEDNVNKGASLSDRDLQKKASIMQKDIVQAQERSQKVVQKIHEEEEIDIDLNDKDVQKSASMIQKQYRKKQQNALRKKK